MSKTVEIHFAMWHKDSGPIEGVTGTSHDSCAAALARWFLPHDWKVDGYDLRAFAKLMLSNGYSIHKVAVELPAPANPPLS